jgi:hypothetical protein
MNKHEAKFITSFRKYARSHFPTCAMEFKSTRGEDTFPMSELYEHQVYALLAVKTVGLFHKIEDAGLATKPFDAVMLKGVCAFVVIEYPQGAAVIDIDTMCTHKGKSLQVDDAKKLSWRFIKKGGW